MKKHVLIVACVLMTHMILGQVDDASRERLSFAKGYFELSGSYYPSFKGKLPGSSGSELVTNSASLNTSLIWGGFHFWDKAEFYVSFPLTALPFNKSTESDFTFTHFTVTGARFYPWRLTERKLRPFVGLSWSAFDFRQIDEENDVMPMHEKNFVLGLDAGLIYNFNALAIRLNANYFPDHTWKYPMSRTSFETIKTPNYGISFGLIYTRDYSKNNGDEKLNERWNKYQKTSKLGYQADSFGDFFVGIGPSISFSLDESQYNRTNYPFLNAKQASEMYWDFALGYQFNKWNMFAAVSFRNPTFEREGFGIKQTITKTSLALEINKFLVDYTGFAPFIGINLAYDQLAYKEIEEGVLLRQKNLNRIEPGLTFGWDIVPGKTSEYLILRTNLRWYPFASFDVENQKFGFKQLEYNLIQALFYPQRLIKSKRS